MHGHVSSASNTTGSQLCVMLRRQPVRPLLIACLTVIVFISLLATFGGTSWNVASLNPYNHHAPSQTPLGDVSNATLGFEKIFVVSLPERTDHRDGMVLASAVSGIDIEFVDGIRGETVPAKALPANLHDGMPQSNIGSWRAHMNAINESVTQPIVRRNLSSALIMEDDIDWDVRLKSLLQDVAVSTNALSQDSSIVEVGFDKLTSLAPPKTSPYGDGWELLWLGHCGMHLPTNGGRVVHKHDGTVPQPQHIRTWDIKEENPLAPYPDHSRVVMLHPEESTCSLAYAITQSGARQILYNLGLQRFNNGFDLMLREWCDGVDNNTPRACLGVIPQLFDHYRRVGPYDHDSDISESEHGYRHNASTLNIRWSVRLNMKNLLRGSTEYDDQYPDT